MSTIADRPIIRAVERVERRSDASVSAVRQLLDGYLGPQNGTARAIDAAAQRARSLAAAGFEELGPLEFIAGALPELCRDEAADGAAIQAVLDATAELVGTTPDAFRLQVAHAMAGGSALLELPPRAPIETVLRVLLVLARLREVSLWQVDELDELHCRSHVGQASSKRVGTLARCVLDGDQGSRSTGLLVGLPVVGTQAPAAAVMARPEPGGRARCDVLMRQFTPLLRNQLERLSLMERAETTEHRLAEAAERRLCRLAFDIHDGPLQNVAGIAGDLAMLRRRLRDALADAHRSAEVLGCVDDLEARLGAADTELRDLCHSLESPTNSCKPFVHMLHEELVGFAHRTDIRAGIEIEGDFDDLTESQRIALWRILQESLANAREHSSAREVLIKASATDDHLLLEVVDDGRGFDVRATLLDAARRGRLGLVGVSERVRLLGGRCDVRSAPGGPTKVAVTLPRWRPET